MCETFRSTYVFKKHVEALPEGDQAVVRCATCFGFSFSFPFHSQDGAVGRVIFVCEISSRCELLPEVVSRSR